MKSLLFVTLCLSTCPLTVSFFSVVLLYDSENRSHTEDFRDIRNDTEYSNVNSWCLYFIIALFDAD